MEPVEDTAQSAPLGELLSRERERQGLSRGEIAQRLHMSAKQVEAMETGEYSRLPRGPFLRGFVRNYAKQLGLPADALLARLDEATPPPPPPGIVVASQNIRFDPMGQRLANPYVKAGVLALIAIALAFAAMYWWLFIRAAPPGGVARKAVDLGPPQQIAAAPVAAPETPLPVDAPKLEPHAEAAVAPVAPSNPADGGVSPKPDARPEPEKGDPARLEAARREAAQPASRAARNERVLRFRFSGESWVEIRDAQGKVLLSQLNAPGSAAQVSGRPPLNVIVGNAGGVRMTSDDRDFPLEPHTRVAVARFTVE